MQKFYNPLFTEILAELIAQERYGVEYQPIVEVNSQEIYGFECLARFFDAAHQSIPPDVVYRTLHTNLRQLCQIEYQQKQLQLAHAPLQTKLFLNLDQDSFFACSDGQCLAFPGVTNGEHLLPSPSLRQMAAAQCDPNTSSNHPFLELFQKHQASDGIVIELIENSEINHARMSLSMISTLAQAHIQTAIDDVCDPQSMISTAVMQLVNFIKLDRYVVQNKYNQNLLLLVQSLIHYVHGTGRKIILEGVETDEDLCFAKQMQIDYVQGFFYRDQFISVS